MSARQGSAHTQSAPRHTQCAPLTCTYASRPCSGLTCTYASHPCSGLTDGRESLAARVGVVTCVGGAAGTLAGLLYSLASTRGRVFEIDSASIGALAGLVSITAAAANIGVWEGALAGFVGGMLACWSRVPLEYIHIDDPVGAIPVHLFGGIWGKRHSGRTKAVPEAASESVPEAASESVPEAASEAVPEAASESVPEAAYGAPTRWRTPDCDGCDECCWQDCSSSASSSATAASAHAPSPVSSMVAAAASLPSRCTPRASSSLRGSFEAHPQTLEQPRWPRARGSSAPFNGAPALALPTPHSSSEFLSLVRGARSARSHSCCSSAA